MSDDSCPLCGAEYDFVKYWRERNQPGLFTIECDECGEIFVVDVTVRPEFRAVRLKFDEEDQAT